MTIRKFEYLGYPVLIEVAGTTGSGFQLYDKEWTYLVSAAHVLFKKSIETFSEPLKITSLDQKTLVKTISHTLDCRALYAANHLLKHRESEVDIAVCRIGKLEHRPDRGEHSYEFQPVEGVTAGGTDETTVMMGIPMIMSSMLEAVHPGDEIYLLGYPTSLAKGEKALDQGYPLIRSGIVAGKPPSNKIIIDCPTYPGNSGGLVMRADDQFAVGVAVRNIGFIEDLYSSVDQKVVSQRRHNTGYTVVEPMDRVLETIQELNTLVH